MRPDPSGHIASFLATNRNYVIADLWTIATVYGEVFPFSGYTTPITVPASCFDAHSLIFGVSSPVTFPLGPRFGRSQVKTKIGLSVDTLTLAIYVNQNDLLGGYTTWQAAVFNGAFDRARVELGRVVCGLQPGGGLSVIGYVVWFQGIVGDIELGRTAINVTVNSSMVMLTTQYPRRLWQATCSHVFGDAMCQFDRQSMAVTVQATAVSGGAISTGFSPNPYNLYNDGTIVALSGANGPLPTRPRGITRTINTIIDGIVHITTQFIYPVAVGDYFSLLPGCDHTLQSCQTLFNNLNHFGGAPYIPQVEFSV